MAYKIKLAIIGLFVVSFGNTGFCAQTVNPSSTPSTKTDQTGVLAPTLTDIRYGEHERHVLDFWKADSKSPTPLVFVIHGGGWTGGSKERVGRFVDVEQLLAAGISVVAVNYRYVSHAPEAGIEPPVKLPLYDAARALQFIRSKASEWHIDKTRIGAAGGSAGACSSLWLAYHDDLADPESNDLIARESTRLQCAAVIGAQTTLDPKQMKEWTPNSKYGGHAFGKRNFEQFLSERESILPWIAEYSPYALVTPDDPPVCLLYSTPPAMGQVQKDPTHTSNFGVKLHEKCTSVGVPCEFVYTAGVTTRHTLASEFLIKTLRPPAQSKYSDGRPAATLRMDAKDQGIVLRYGDGPGQCDRLGARDVWVFEDGGTYYMHYDAAGPKGWLCSLAVSKDLLTWEKKGPILDFGAPGEDDSKSASYGVTYCDGQEWHMFYLGTPNVSNAPDLVPSFPYLTMKAKGSSGAGPWIKQKDVIPFRTKPGTYYAITASPGQVIRQGDEYLQFFSATTRKPGNPCVQRTLGIARTKDLDGAWTVDPEPMVPIEEQIENSTLYYEKSNRIWFLFTNHIGIDKGEYTDAIWVYWSKDLNKWDPENKAVVLDSQNCTWSSKCIGLPSVVQVGKRLALFYDAPGGNSTSHMRRHIGLAWLDLPLSVPASREARPDVSAPQSITPADLRCEYLVNPLGIDVVKPRMSWKLESDVRGQKQTAYRLVVASTSDTLNRNIGDLWDSGKVQSDQSIHVAYKGKTLESRIQCFWKVRVWDKDGNASTWSEPAKWSMGLLEPEDWKAKWISTSDAQTSPYYRQSFQVDDLPERATIYVAALGYFELFVNGQKVGDEVLAPAVSNFSKRTYYRTYDVASYLKTGKNSLAIWMGTGWYSPGLPGVKHHSPVVRAQLELSSGGIEQRIATDTSWQTKPSERKLLGEWRWGKFGGEQVDARLMDQAWWDAEKSTTGWTSVVETDVAEVPCSAQSCGGNVGFSVVTPQSVEMLDKDTVLVDFGTNLTGLMNMTFRNLKPGQKISMYYGDLDGRQEDEAWRAKQTKKGFAVYGQFDELVSAGAAEETFRNKFNYHAFRYVLIEGLSYVPDKADMAAVPVETQVVETGTFTCSNELYNRIHTMVRWTYRCLNLGGQTVDCPHRERLGYGDGQTIMDTGCFNFDVAALYAKWSQNWWDEQTDDGFVPFTAPCPNSTGGGPAWGAMCIMVPWKTYLFNNDRRLLEQGYPYMKKYLGYLTAHCEDGILQDIFPGERWPNLGDWVPPRRGMDKKDWVEDRSRRFFNNCYRVHLLQIMQTIAGLLGKGDDVKAFEQDMRFAQKKIHDAWFNVKDNTYANGEQPYLIFPLQTGVTPDALKPAVFEKYVETLLETDKGHLNTGMIGTQLMVDTLLEMDRNDLVDTFVNKTTFPGWGYMVEKGATTCWEQWNGYFSQIHSCFPYIGGWFYRGLAGIRWDPETPGFKHVILRPALVKSVDWVKCSTESPYGKIVSNWTLENGSFMWDISVPVNSTATVHVPAKNVKSISEGGNSLQEAAGVTFLKMEGQRAVLRVESGSYRFISKYDRGNE